MNEDYDYQVPVRRGPSGAATMFLAFMTSVATFTGLRYLEHLGHLEPGQRVAEVPSVLGLNAGDAREALRGRGLTLVIEAEREDTKTPGLLIAQRPLAGSQLPRGASVATIISRGLSQVAVPALAGETAESAARRLDSLGLKTGATKSIPSDTVPAGQVVATVPPPGTLAVPQTAVELTISAGRVGKAVPKLTGLKVAKAKQAITDAGFTIGKLRYDYDSDRAGNIVLGQDPAEGATVAPGTPIGLTINEP